ncbi:MAG: carboxypeptidase regulatory-like domain-containing protein [bacterium]
MSRGSRILALVVVVLFIFSIVGCSSGGGSNQPAPGGSTGGNTVKGHVDLNGVPPSKVTVSVEGTELEVTPDANGYFEILNVPEGQHTVSVQFEDGDLASYINFISGSGGEIDVGDISLYYCGNISGQVTTSQGQGLSGARIAAYPLISSGSQELNAYMPVLLETQTDSNGSYSLTGVPAMSYQVIASKDGFEQIEKTAVVVERATFTCDFQLPAVSGDKGSIGGTVYYKNTDGSLYAAPGTSVALYAPSGSEALYTTATGWDGTYSISGVPSGSYRAVAANDTFGEDTENVSISGGSRTSRDFTLQSQGASIHGLIKDAQTAQPIEGAFVQLESLSSSSSYFIFFSLTDQNGEYTLENVSAGNYKVNAFKWGSYEDASQTVSVSTGAALTVNLQMEPSTQPPVPTFSPLPEPSYSPIPEPSYSPFPEPSYSPYPEPSYPPFSPLPEPSYSPLPEPSYSPLPEPSYSPIPEPTYSPSDPSFSCLVTVCTDKSTYSVGENVQITLDLLNYSTTPITLHFPTSQQYDFVLTPGSGGLMDYSDDISFEFVSMKSKADDLWRWSNGQTFAQVQTDLTVQPGENLIYTINWDQKDNSGQQIASGAYNLDGIITANPQIGAIFTSPIFIGSY